MINPDQVAMEAEQSSQFESHNQSEIRNLVWILFSKTLMFNSKSVKIWEQLF